MGTPEYARRGGIELEFHYVAMSARGQRYGADWNQLLWLKWGLSKWLGFSCTGYLAHLFGKSHSESDSVLAGLSSDSVHIIATRSGHYILLEQPDLVIAAIKQVLTGKV